MPDLVPIPLTTLLKRAYHEPGLQQTLFDLPLKDFFRGTPGADTAVRFHDLDAGTPLGPAAGPHDQLAQNVVLAWLGGSRIIELKTIQVLDELTINRPCIDMTNIGFNIEWSQELKLQQALREYVKASMMIEILRAENILGIEDLTAVSGHFFDVVFDMSVGYDLKGIQSSTVSSFIDAIKDARQVVDELRPQIPDEYARYRDHPFRTDLVKTATLSTFHGCPKDEIEKICRHLLEEKGLHTIVKLNPVQIGKEKLEHILYERLGYTHLKVNQKAYETGLSLKEALELVQRLEPIGKKRGLNIGVKFSNTLEVHNTLGRMPDEVMYLSGQPLHVIAVSLVAEWRALADTRYPISFAAGIDHRNFAEAVAMDLVPVTVCTDLLRPRGYGRQPGYLTELAAAMKKVEATNVDEYVMRARGSGAADRDRAVLHNTRVIAQETLDDKRYSWAQNSKEPNKIKSHLYVFDCISCDKCLPVCPNDANFVFDVEPVRFQYRDYRLTRGDLLPDESRWFAIEQKHQLANFADLCNECGNCDTFCPEYGGPFIEKPGFFASRASYEGRPNHDGFFIERTDGVDRIEGRIQGQTYRLGVKQAGDEATFDDGAVELRLKLSTRELVEWKALDPALAVHDPSRVPHQSRPDHVVQMGNLFRMEALLRGVLDSGRASFVNAQYLAVRVISTAAQTGPIRA
ncbi:MAG: 4Fe-4S dicluster domain-containing protein [Candidatus Dormibacterales bacterium]